MFYHNKMKRNIRSGFTTFELVAAIFLVTVCMTVFAQLVYTTSGYRQSREMTQAAQDQLLNVLEMLDREEPEKLKNLDFDKQPFEELLANTLPGGKVAFSIKPFPGGEDSALLEVTVHWDAGQKRPPRELTFVKWVFADPKPREAAQEETP